MKTHVAFSIIAILILLAFAGCDMPLSDGSEQDTPTNTPPQGTEETDTLSTAVDVMRAMYEVIYLANHPESEDNPYKPTENNDGTLTYSFNTFTAFNGIIITGSCTADAGKDILSADIIYIQPNMEDYESFTMNQKADNTATISFGDEDPISIDREKLPRQLTVEKGGFL